jgi:gamma-glutamylputrescine oxidase
VLDTPVREVHAGQVVLALNAYLPRLLPSLRRYVKPIRAQMLSTAPLPPPWIHLPAYTHEGFYYFRQCPDGTILLGGARHLHLREEAGYVDETTPALQADLEEYLRVHFPRAAGATIRSRWSGVMGYSPDFLPVVGTVPGIDGSYWVTGFSGHGLGYGFRFGRLMAELTLGVPHVEGFALFAAQRFANDAAVPTDPAPTRTG